MKRIHLTDDARADLLDIRRYTAQKFGSKQARQYHVLLEQGLKLLRRHPEIGFTVDDLKAGYRCFKIEYHRVFYALGKDSINVLAILHESRLPARHISQRTVQDEE